MDRLGWLILEGTQHILDACSFSGSVDRTLKSHFAVDSYWYRKMFTNPYQSPNELASGPSFHDGISITAVCIGRTWFSRHIRLTGGINADIRYHAAGHGERIFVNDIHVGTGSPWHLTTVVAPRIEFEIDCGSSSVPATAEIYAAWLQLFRVTKFSLSVDGKVVYAEPSYG